MTSVAFITLGCKVNQYDSDVMKTSFLKRGYSIVEFSGKADIYVVNTCTVTGIAARKSRQMAARARKQNPNSIVVVTGCLGQLESNDVREMTDADIVTGNVEKEKIVDLVEEYTGNDILENGDIFSELEYIQKVNSTQDARTRVFIKVQDGCNNYCSYCAIPFARGRSRSRNRKDILNEIRSYTEKGTHEVVITGIHLDSYGEDLDGHSLIVLLEDIDKIDGLSRVRLGSLEPASITPEFVRRAVLLKKLCPHFHLSLQSGCDETLKRMKRRYTTAEFLTASELLKKSFHRVALTTDVIVGFPGESDEEFKQTVEFVDSVGFMKIHVFRFSARKGTLAYGMPDKVPGDIKKQRSEILSGISDEGFRRFIKNSMNESHGVIIERESEIYPGFWEGHTANYIKVLFRCYKCSPGNEYFVKFNKTSDDFVFSTLRIDM